MELGDPAVGHLNDEIRFYIENLTIWLYITARGCDEHINIYLMIPTFQPDITFKHDF